MRAAPPSVSVVSLSRVRTICLGVGLQEPYTERMLHRLHLTAVRMPRTKSPRKKLDLASSRCKRQESILLVLMRQTGLLLRQQQLLTVCTTLHRTSAVFFTRAIGPFWLPVVI